MRTTIGVFLVLWLLVMLPLVLLNIKKFRLKKPGGKQYPNYPRILIVGVAAVAVTIFVISLFQFTIHYQSQLVLERYFVPIAQAVEKGDSSNNPDALLLEQMGGKNSKFAVQFGEDIQAKYSVDSVLPDSAGLSPTDKSTIYLAARIRANDDSSTDRIIVAKMHLKQNKWQIIAIYPADETIENYLLNNKFIYADYISPWRQLN